MTANHFHAADAQTWIRNDKSAYRQEKVSDDNGVLSKESKDDSVVLHATFSWD